MARTIIDSVGVELTLEDSDLFRGLGIANQALEDFRRSSRPPVALALELDTSGLAQGTQEALAELSQLGPSTASVAASLERLGASSDTAQGPLRRLGEAEQRTAQQAALLSTANQRLIAGMSQAGRAAEAASAGTRVWERGLANLRSQQQLLGPGFALAGRGSDQLRSSLTQLAVQASGTTPVVGQLTSALLLMGPGSAAVAGAAAGVALLAGAYRRFTRDAREAAEEQRKLNEQLDAAIASRNPLPRLTSNAEDLGRQLKEVNDEIARLNASQGQATFAAGATGASEARLGIITQTEIDNTARISQLEEKREQILERMGEAARQLSEFYASTPQARALADAAQDQARALEEGARAVERVLGRFGPETSLELPPLELKPRVDFSEVRAAIAREAGELQASLQDVGNAEVFLGLSPEVTREIERANQAAAALLVVLQDVDLKLEDIGNANITGPRAAAEALANELRDLNRGLDQVVTGARNIGLIGEEAQRAIGSVQNLTDAVSDLIQSGTTAGGILGVIGTGLSVLGSIGGALGIGTSPEEKAREQASRELRLAIDRLTREIGNIGIDITGETFSGLEKAFGVITDPSKFRLEDNTKLGLRVEDVLEGFGLTIDDVKAAAAEMGIEFHNTADFYRGFAEGLKELELTQFATTFTGQLTKLTAGFDILGITDPREQFEQLAQLAASPEFGAPAVAEALKRFNVNLADGLDEGEVESAREALRDVFRNFENLTAEDLGGLTAEQLLELLAQGTDLATQALGGFSQELSSFNVPTGFKSERFAFLAQEPLSPAQQALLPPIEVKAAELPAGDAKEVSAPLVPLLEGIANRTPDDMLGRLDLIASLLGGEVEPGTDAGGLLPTATPPTLGGDGASLPLLADLLEGNLARFADLFGAAAEPPSVPEAGVTEGQGAAPQQTFTGAISIEIKGEQKDPEQIAREVLRELRAIAMRQTGDTLQVGLF